MSDPQIYIPENDVTKTLPDGREELVAAGGIAMPWAKALALGLVKQSQPQGPSETKAEGDQDDDGQPGNQLPDPNQGTPITGTIETLSGLPGEAVQLPGSDLPPVVTLDDGNVEPITDIVEGNAALTPPATPPRRRNQSANKAVEAAEASKGDVPADEQAES